MTDIASTEMTATNLAPPGTEPLESRLEQYRVELTAYCYRMLGSAFEAEDAVQDAFVRAWRNFDKFEGRSSLRSWLYRIATNVCLDMLTGRERRARPMDLGPALTADHPLGSPLPEVTWLQPIPDGRVLPVGGDPAAVAEVRESVRLAFVAALQLLPPRQRAVLILREVLKWKASEVAELLDTTVVSVNSALQRARATLAERNLTTLEANDVVDERQRELLDRYVEAFEAFDIPSLVQLLRDDATMSMPPYPLWLQGADELGAWLRGPGSACRGSRLAPVEANGAPAFAQWRRDADGNYYAWCIHVLRISRGRIAGIDFFVDEKLFPLFGQPVVVDA